MTHTGVLRRAAAVLARPAEDFFPGAVDEVGRVLAAELVYIGEFTNDGQLETVAVSRRGRLDENLTFDLKGTVAGHVQATGRPEQCNAPALARFPHDPTVATARALMALPIVGGGATIGVLVAASSQPLAVTEEAKALLQILCGRAGPELQRARNERELRKREEHIRQVQQVEAIGRLAGGIAHDFNNLLMVIIGYAEILRDRHGASTELIELTGAAHRAGGLTRQLLAYGRRQILRKEAVDLNQVVVQVKGMLAPVISPAVQVVTGLSPTLPPVDADRGQFEQVLVNLALNARDAMPHGGTLSVTTSVEHVTRAYRQMPADTYVCLTVADTGLGMDEDVKAHIFEPFYTTKGGQGSGLGLSSVYGIVKQSGGFIWCDSMPGRGTTFRIYLRPLSQERLPAPAATLPDVAQAPAGRILVVDDEVNARRWVSRVLRARGYDVVDVEDGAAALELMRTGSPRPVMVITDIVMPGVNGTRLAEEIEQQWPGTKLLFVSGFASSAAVRASSVVARVPVLQKPFTPANIADTVRALLESEPHQPRVA
jgi:signal transduction histidine kinase/ActR/RegA family two-component response regulator